MHVLLYLDTDAFAGTESHVITLASALRQSGTTVTIACPAGSPLEQRAAAMGVPVLQLRASIRGRAASVYTLRRLLRSGEVDLIHAHNGRTALIAALAARLAGRGRCVFTQHFITPAHAHRTGIKAWLSRMAHRWVERHTHGQIAVSIAVRDAMLARVGHHACEVSIIPNGISVSPEGNPRSAAQIRDEFNVPDGAVMVACASRLEPEKDLLTLIQAMSLLPESRAEVVKLVIAGTGSQDAELRALLKERELGDCVTLAGFRKDVLAVVAAADLFVLPSRAEPFGLAILEAMALGKPVVATAAGGPLEIVEAGQTGLLVQPGHPAELADAIHRLAGEPELRQTMGSRGRTRFLNHFTADRMALATAAVYRKVLGSPDASATQVARPIESAA